MVTTLITRSVRSAKTPMLCAPGRNVLAAGFWCLATLAANGESQSPELDSDTMNEIADIATDRKKEISEAMVALRQDLLASTGREPTLRENNAIRLEQPRLDVLLDAGVRVISEIPLDWDAIEVTLVGICYSHEDYRVVEFCVNVLKLPVDLESKQANSWRSCVSLVIAILAQQGSPEALSVLRECVMLSFLESPRGNSALLQPIDSDRLSSERVRLYSGNAISSVLDCVASDRVVPFFEDIADSIVDPDFRFKRAARAYLEIAERIEQGHPNPHNVVK